ncbi:MAG: bacillithiol biosynthesis cysteine-adding enzyme BshC [Candidatus Aminicenantaceae bacterium]
MRSKTSPLIVDYLNHFDRVEDFFNGDFRDPDAFRRQAEAVRARRLDRERLAEVLREQNQGYGCGPLTLQNIDKLARAETCAVVTGQQVGLFSGPLYTVYKALTAIRLAESLERDSEGGCVPVFWLASDDHDIAEIDHVELLDQDNRIREIRFPDYNAELRLPASDVILTREVRACLQQLEALTRDSEFKPEILAHLGAAYSPGRSFADAFALWMTRIFSAYGLVFIDAADPRLKDLGKEAFQHEIAENSPSTEQALDTSKRLEQAGYPVQVRLHKGILNLFYVEPERQAVSYRAGDFHIKGSEQPRSREGLLALAAEKPHLFSPNVLLRPVYQDMLLPTVAYVGGPGEIAYLAQMKGIYQSFGLPMPIIYPRKNIILQEKKVEHVLDNLELRIPDFHGRVDSLITRIFRDELPESLCLALAAAASHLEQDFQAIRSEIAALDPTLEKSVEASLGRVDRELKSLEKKALQALMKRSSIAADQVNKAKNCLFPRDRPQERVFNVTPFLIKYGYALVDKLYKAIDMDDCEYQILQV